MDYYLPTDDPKCLSYQTLLTRLLGFLSGLNREYDDIRRRALHCKNGLPKLAELVKELKEEESHFLLHGFPATEVSRDSSTLLTPVTCNGLLGRTPSTTGVSKAPIPTTIVCSCSRAGHTHDKCYKLTSDLKKKKKKSQSKALMTQSVLSNSTASSSVATVEQLRADLARLSAQMSPLQAPSTTSFFGVFSSPPSTEWYCGHTALTSPIVSDMTWVLDSGATEYMTPFNSRFVSYQRHTGGHTVLTTNGGHLPVAGIGAVYVDGLGVVQHVLHVPALRAILMSPQRLVDLVLCSFHL